MHLQKAESLRQINKKTEKDDLPDTGDLGKLSL